MTFPILGGNGAVADAQASSLRFNDDDSAYLSRTQTSGNRKTFTWSAWVKRGVISTRQTLLSSGIDGSNESFLRFDASDYISIKESTSNSPEFAFDTTPVFRDASAWYHIVFVVDTTQGTDSNRVKLYVNGSQITSFSSTNYPSQNYDTRFNNNSQAFYLGQNVPAYPDYFDGYMADVHFIDGQAKAPTDFGEFDSSSGIWKVKEYEGTYGTNGFKLNFSDSGSLGADSSGNGNDFTATNLASTDQTTDTPTNNFATMNPLGTNNIATHSEGNTKLTTGDGASISGATIAMTQGQWYAEFICTAKTSVNMNVGIVRADTFDGDNQMDEGNNVGYMYQNTGDIFHGGANESYGASWAVNDVIGIAFNADNLNVEFFKNGVGQGNYTRIASENSGGDWIMCVGEGQGSGTTATFECNFGNPPSAVSSGNSDDNGYGNFEYAPPSGYLALCTQNLATELSPTIDDGSQYFNTLTWSGDNTTRSFTGLGFSPDWTWIKSRSDGAGHGLFDSVRGANKQLNSGGTGAEITNHQFGYLSSFDSDGFTLTPGTYSGYESGDTNMTGRTYVGWNWRGSDSNAVSNTDGSITSTVSANTTAGFSIVTYTGNRTAGATVGHGLGVAPSMVIAKCRTASAGWPVFHASLGGSNFVRLNETSASASNSVMWNNTAPSSTVVTLGGGDETNNDTGGSVMYCFAEIEGYSKIGTYAGNNSDNGTFIYLGFRPSFILMKSYTSGENWLIYDNKRDTHNVTDEALLPNSGSASGGSANAMDFLSNGFKLRSSAGSLNGSSQSYLYYAIAESPFVDSNGIPVTAR